MIKTKSGFTIVELLIVIVVIGILAAITVVAYNGIQARAKDTQRKSDVVAIIKALELYYIDKGEFPAGAGSTTIGSPWSTTADASWQNLRNLLVPGYISNLPSDPVNTPNVFVASNASYYSYAYYANDGTYCGTQPKQMFILVYRLASESQQNTLIGNCPSNALIYGGASNYRVSKL